VESKVKTIVYCFVLLILNLPALAAESGLLRSTNSWIPYVERIRPDEIALIEHQLDEPLSARSDLLVYTGDEAGKIYFAFSLRRANGEFHLECRKYYPQVAFSNKTIRLPRDVAERLIKTFELILTKQVFPVTGPAAGSAPKTEGSVIWIHLRGPGGTGTLGKVLYPDTRCWMGIPPSNRPFFEVYYRLTRLFDDRVRADAPIADLDIALRELPLSYPK
jgi:hypothetical protein